MYLCPCHVSGPQAGAGAGGVLLVSPVEAQATERLFKENSQLFRADQRLVHVRKGQKRYIAHSEIQA